MRSFRILYLPITTLLLPASLFSQDLKAQLRRIAADEYQIPAGTKAYDMGLEMLAQIGCTDSELRDELIYTIFYKWIDSGHFSKDEMRKMVEICLDEAHLFFGIGDEESDSVFKRSFTILVLAELVGGHRKSPYLSGAKVKTIKRKIIDYLGREKDLRGFVPEKGWAHAIAHSADLLNQLVQCKELGPEDYQEILEVIRSTMSTSLTAYTHGEEWRTARVIITLLRQSLVSKAQIAPWLKGFADRVLHPMVQPSVEERTRRYTNVKNFLLNLHLRTLREPLSVDIAANVFETLKTITGGFEN